MLQGFDVRREDLMSASGSSEEKQSFQAVWPINQLSTRGHFGDNKNSSNPVNGLRVC